MNKLLMSSEQFKQKIMQDVYKIKKNLLPFLYTKKTCIFNSLI